MKVWHTRRKLPTMTSKVLMMVITMMLFYVFDLLQNDASTTSTSTTGSIPSIRFVQAFKRISILSKKQTSSSSSSSSSSLLLLSNRNNNSSSKKNNIHGPHRRRVTTPSVSPSSSTSTTAKATVSTSVSVPDRQHKSSSSSNPQQQQQPYDYNYYYYSNPKHIQQTLIYIQWLTFLIMMSSSMVAFIPVQATLQLFSNDQSHPSHAAATQYLSIFTTIAAFIELTCSPSIGSLLDRIGRKVLLLIIIGIIILLHSMTAILLQPMNLITIALQKCIGTIAIGFFMITIQTIITDLVILLSSTTSSSSSSSSSTTSITTTSQQQSNLMLSSVMGQQMAVTGIGFLFGIATAGIVSKYCVSQNYNVIMYSIAAILTLFAYILIYFQFYETYDTSMYHKNIPVIDPSKTLPNITWIESIKSLGKNVGHSLLSCTNLLTKYGIKIRIFSILLLIMTLPMYMGDLFQIYAKTEWNLSTSMFSTYLSLFAITGIVSNVVGSMLIKSMGIRTFTQIAIVSKMIPSLLTILFGYRGSMIGIMVGFLGNAQSIGIVAALISQSSTTTTTTTNTSTATSRTVVTHRDTHQKKQPPHSSSSSSIITSSETMKQTSSSSMSPSQGVMAGERASLMALLKVIGPILYSTLYIQGRHYFHTSTVPFVFNIMLSIIALLITSYYL